MYNNYKNLLKLMIQIQAQPILIYVQFILKSVNINKLIYK
jgi:hypothetical protein